MHNKRGMSAVVTTLIIILLTIVALGIVWVVVKNIIDKGSDEITLTGLTLDLEIVKAVSDDTFVNVTVKRNPGEGNLVGINFIFSDGDNSDVVRVDTNLAELGWQTFIFLRNDLAVDNITSIAVAPIFETSSGKETIGNAVDTAEYDTDELGSGGGVGAGGGDPPACTPECTGLECGDDGCGGSCGDCGVGFSCADNQLCVDDSCIDEDPLVTCAAAECGTLFNNCGNEVICGDCTSYGENYVCSVGICVEGCTDTCESLEIECGIHEICGVDLNCEVETGGCLSGFECVVGNDICQAITYINSGLVGWYGPPDVTQFFSSDSLPKTDGLYYGSAATFPDIAVPDCYLIIGYSYRVYENAIVELNLESPLVISTDEPYQIWESMSDCLSSL